MIENIVKCGVERVGIAMLKHRSNQDASVNTHPKTGNVLLARLLGENKLKKKTNSDISFKD